MKSKILIWVDGGNIQSIQSTQDVDVMVVDWDNIDAGDDIPEDFDYPVEIKEKLSESYKNHKGDEDEERLYEVLKKLDV